uniref:Protein MNN4-like n=1 Tax=Cucumis melo TaxID=3656 RepID=A0A9I9DKC0_CUCME
MPTRHDNTISMERIMMVYCIIEHLLVNIGKTIREHIIAWVKHPRGARHFPNLIEKLCLNACPMLEQLPQVENKAKLKRLKTKQDGKSEVEKGDEEVEDEKEEVEVPLKRKRQGEEEASRSKKAKSSKVKNSKEILSLVSTKSSKKKKPTKSPSLDKSIHDGHISQNPTKSKCHHLPKNSNRQPHPNKSKIPLPSRQELNENLVLAV